MKRNESVLITGASSGIGFVTANYLCQLGYQVFAGIRTSSNEVKFEDGIVPVTLDVTDEKSVTTAFRIIRNTTSAGLGAVVCNAGLPQAGPMEHLNLQRFNDLLDVNVLGNIRIIQASIPLLRSQSGTIIFIGSISGRISLPFQGAYSASKFALEAITDALRVELRPWNIPVTIIEPGNVKTKIRTRALSNIEADLTALTPQHRLLYEPIYRFALNHASRKSAEPIAVAKLVERILRSNKIKPRYLLGKDAILLHLISRLPTAWRDRIISSKLPEYGN
ncbi:SDR family oxidoreductase [Verrucomicrobia bacterium S94]|nr:SDR family oxidoreductase [Verrucomicrobia bacterium S94]